MNQWAKLLAILAVAAFVATGCSGGGETPVTPNAFLRIITPNGGEEWIPGSDHEITWVSQYIDGTVIIECSRDNFVSDINLIAADEPNDGSYLWEHIPSDFNHTVRIRISWTDYPTVNDISDDDFSIVDFGWARTWGGSYRDKGYAVATDGSGNVYVTGWFEGTVDFDPDGDGDPHTSNGIYDVFLSKFDSSGNFEWARTWGGSNWDEGLGVAIDDSGNVYITGYYCYTVDFNPDGGDPHTSNGWTDGFLSKFNSSGNFEWARSWGGSNRDPGNGVATDDSGNIYVTGYFQKTVDFAPTDPPCNENPDEHISNGYIDVFLTKHLPDGCW